LRHEPHCIGNAAELIQWGKQDIVFAGGGEELELTLSFCSTGMGCDVKPHTTTTPSAPVGPSTKIATALLSPAAVAPWCTRSWTTHGPAPPKIYAELTGYGATSDGYDMVAPSGEGAVRCMRQAMANVKAPIDYVNAHGTVHPCGPMHRNHAMREVFGKNMPKVNSTKIA